MGFKIPQLSTALFKMGENVFVFLKLVGSMPITLLAARRHTALLRYGRPEIESRLVDLSRTWPHSLSHFASLLHCPIKVKAKNTTLHASIHQILCCRRVKQTMNMSD